MAKRQKTKKPRPGRLRIVAGKWRSRLLDITDVPGLRPTSERIRETLFNWLEPRINGARCLDLFAGTGALGLEALSRGARQVIFVEKSARAVGTLNANIATLGAAGAVVRHMDALDYLRGEQDERFDLVFLDPPFAADMINELCRLLAERELLAEDACVYIEQGRSGADPGLPAGWDVLKNKTAGNVRYMLVRQSR
jgi:16S rRNA (guanine966-N2)-methyltransferase